MEKCGFESTAVEKLRAQLIEEQSSVSIVTFDPVSRFFNLRCSLHPESWEARANNCIGSYSTGRKGTRCPECRHEKTGKIKRLKPNELIEKAEIQGFKPSFGPDVYRRNDQYLPWECLKCLNTIKDNWRHLSSGRGCKICNDESKRLENAKKEMGEIGKIVKKNKDTLISNYKSYKNQQTKIHLNCSRPGGCKQKFYMRAQKVKAGQLHRCDKYMRGAIATRRTKMQAF